MTNGGSVLIAIRIAVGAFLCASVASCASTPNKPEVRRKSKEYFAESEYGVKASPRVHVGKDVPKGGGRRQLGKPYVVKGKLYVPKEDTRYKKVGLASWYGSAFHGRLTANGEIYDQYHLSAAHPTFPLPSYARVTNLSNGNSLIVRVNDRGPYHPGRIIDVSKKAAEMLDIKHHGTAKVQVQYVGQAPLHGQDMPYLMASYRSKTDKIDRFEPQIATGVMVASNDPSDGMQQSDDLSASTALRSDKAAPASTSFDDIAGFAPLPEFGPIPEERPEVTYRLANSADSGLVAGYAEFRVEQAASPFDAILGKPVLTPDAIRASWQRRIAGKS